MTKYHLWLKFYMTIINICEIVNQPGCMTIFYRRYVPNFRPTSLAWYFIGLKHDLLAQDVE